MQNKTLILSTVFTVLAVQVCLSPIAHSEPVSVLVAQAPNKSAKPVSGQASSEQATSTKTPSIQPASSREDLDKDRRMSQRGKDDTFQRYRHIDLPHQKFNFLDPIQDRKVAFDARTEFTLARCAVQENQPEKADNYFKGTIETLKAKEHDPKFENEVYEAYAAFLKSEHRPDEAKAILEQLRAKQRIAPKPEKRKK